MSLFKRVSLTSWIFIALVIGILMGIFFPDFAKSLAPISNIFLRLIKSIVGPLLFGTLVYGIASAGELKTMGRIALKAVTYFEIATTFALVIGLTLSTSCTRVGHYARQHHRRPSQARQSRDRCPDPGTCGTAEHL